MNGSDEMRSLLSDAREALRSSEEAHERVDYRITVQQAQLAAELSAKSVIAYFEEPRWTHDPSGQFRRVMEGEEIEAVLENHALKNCEKFAQYVRELAPWHSWSIYGRMEGGRRIRASDLCTAEVGEDALNKAKFCISTAEMLIVAMDRNGQRIS